jgi:hypothetical protein
MEKYVYFRNVSDVADDDDRQSSCLFPLSSFVGGYTTSAVSIVLFFKCMHEYKAKANISRDSITITTSSGLSGSIFNSIMQEFSTGENYFIEIADDVSGKYITPGITGIISISVTNDDS